MNTEYGGQIDDIYTDSERASARVSIVDLQFNKPLI